MMRTREMAYTIVNGMTETELEKFVFHYLGFSGVPNQETLDALEELHYMEEHPEEYVAYDTPEEMFEDLLK